MTIRILRGLGTDLRHAASGLRRAPLFTAVAVATIALGIGAATTLFTVIDGVLIRPLPYRDATHILSVSLAAGGKDHFVVDDAQIRDWATGLRSVDQLAAYTTKTAALSGVGEPTQLTGALVEPRLFALLGIHQALGRLFVPGDERPGAPRQVVLSAQLWRERFAGDPHVIGRNVDLDGLPYTVIGVLGSEQAFPRSAAFWMPLFVGPTATGVSWFYDVLARPRPGLPLSAVRAELTARLHPPAAGHPDDAESVVVMSLHDRLFGSVRTPLLLLFGAVGCLLLIACANVANLLLARGALRRDELAVRAALGAGRWRIARLLVLESLLIAGVGAIGGLLIPAWSVPTFVRMSPDVIARAGTLHVNTHVALFAVLAGLATGLLFGVLPALATVGGVESPLSRAGRHATPHLRLRQALITAELALAMVLLAGAGLLVRSLANVIGTDLGFAPDHLAAATIFLPSARYPHDQERAAFFTALLERAKAIPGVTVAALSDAPPPAGLSVTVSASVFSGKRGQSVQIAVNTVTHRYPQAVGLRLVSGRTFTAADVRGAPVVALVNAAAARLIAPDSSPLGRRLPPSFVTDSQPAIVVGVVKNIPQFGVLADPMPRVYFVRDQVGGDVRALVLRSSVDPARLESAVRHVVAALDPLQPVSAFDVVGDVLAHDVAPRRLDTILLAAFAALAAMLAGIGLYGVVSYSASQRRREFGIRLALGAERRDMVRLMMRGAAAMIGIGLLVGVGAALLTAHLLVSLPFGVAPIDLLTLGATAALLAAIAGIAALIPALRASRVYPMVALRDG
ncbi:MAG: ABC transporter permease [Gemmatimonadales bacterium]